EVAEPRGRVLRRESGPEPAHPLHRRGEVRAGLVALHAVRAGVAHELRHVRGAQYALRRHAAEVEAVAAHEIPLDEGDARAEPGRARGGHEPGGAGADDDEVVAAGGPGVRPPGRMDVLDQPAIVEVVGWKKARHSASHTWRLLRLTPRAGCRPGSRGS